MHFRKTSISRAYSFFKKRHYSWDLSIQKGGISNRGDYSTNDLGTTVATQIGA